MTGPSPYLAAAGREELPALTGLRLFAALAVVLWHAVALLPALPPAFAHFYLGVDLFFMLSGFIIAHVYWDDFASGRAARGGAYRRFVALRLARIWPAHVAAVALFLASIAFVAALRGRVLPWSDLALELPLHLVLAHNWGPIPSPQLNHPSWSVSAEFLAYLLFPLQVALFRHLRRPVPLLLAVPLALALCWLLQSALLGLPLGHAGPAANIRVLCEFAMGVALFRLRQGGWLRHLPWTPLLLACLAAMAVIAALTPPRHPADYAIVLLMAPLLLGLSYGRSPLARLLAWRPLVYLGEISYSVYLMHALAIVAAAALAGLLSPLLDGRRTGWDLVALAVALSLIGGAALFHLVEKPARNWLRARVDRHLPAPHWQATPT